MLKTRLQEPGFLVTIKRQVIFPEIEGPYETDIRREDGKKKIL